MRKAFTLVELMIVVAISGIVAAVVLPGVRGNMDDARQSVAKDHLRKMRLKISLYKLRHNGVQPGYEDGKKKNADTIEEQFIFCTNLVGESSLSKTPSGEYLYGPYFWELPENPFNGRSTFDIVSESKMFAEKADGTSSGWLYKIETGEIRCNSVGTDGNGIKYYDY